MEAIVENACLLHDIGNPPFGHFGEEAIKDWSKQNKKDLVLQEDDELPLGFKVRREKRERLKKLCYNHFRLFDGNAQSFRIATRLHCEVDEYGLNLTSSTLLASVKYPNCGEIKRHALFPEKLGVFFSENERYEKLSEIASLAPGRRYFLAYLMELADDICYCLSDITDSFEKGITNSREFKEEFGKICKENAVNDKDFISQTPISNFGYEVGIRVARRLIDEAALKFVHNFEQYLSGDAPEMAKELPSGIILKCLKIFARRFIYTNREAQRIEIAGARVVEGLLDHFGRLLKLPKADFVYFVEKGDVVKRRGLDTEWRIFNQLSKRMLQVYRHDTRSCSDSEERICRARFVVDYISGMTDNSALETYQNFMGISL